MGVLHVLRQGRDRGGWVLLKFCAKLHLLAPRSHASAQDRGASLGAGPSVLTLGDHRQTTMTGHLQCMTLGGPLHL